MNDTEIIEVNLEIKDSLFKMLDKKEKIKKEICNEINKELNKILEILGIPGMPKASLIKLDDNNVSLNRFLGVKVNEVHCTYPDLILIRIQHYINRIYVDDKSYKLSMDLNNIFNWLKSILIDLDVKNPTITFRGLIEFFSISCLEIIKLQPEVLFNSSQIDTYLSNALIASENRDRIYTILRKVLNHRISIANKNKVKMTIEKGISEGRSNEDIIEDLLVALRPNAIQIQVPIDYFKIIMKAEKTIIDSRDKFKMIRDGLFYELGVRYPDFQFVINNDLKPNCFSFRLNHLTTLIHLGLKPEELLVNDSSDRLTLLKVSGIPTLNPVNPNEYSIINSKNVELVESAGLTTWDYLGYLILTFSGVLRRNSYLFINSDYFSKDLDSLSDLPSPFALYFPQLVDALKSVISVESITRLLRSLVSEEISIRNLRHIYELILDFYLNLKFDQNNNVWQNEHEHLITFVRAGLNRQISHNFSSRDHTVVVYLLDSEIESKLLEYKSYKNKELIEDQTCKKILSMIREELGSSLISNIPVFITKTELRSIVRKIIALEFPRVAVLAYSELSSDLNIQPIARIFLRKEK